MFSKKVILFCTVLTSFISTLFFSNGSTIGDSVLETPNYEEVNLKNMDYQEYLNVNKSAIINGNGYELEKLPYFKPELSDDIVEIEVPSDLVITPVPLDEK